MANQVPEPSISPSLPYFFLLFVYGSDLIQDVPCSQTGKFCQDTKKGKTRQGKVLGGESQTKYYISV